mgnify:CR=1 FL=1
MENSDSLAQSIRSIGKSQSRSQAEPRVSCSICQGTGWIYIEDAVKECVCRVFQRICGRMAVLPKAFRMIDPAMTNLREGQDRVIHGVLEAKPNASIFVTGDHGAGKTFVLALVYHRSACETNRRLWYASVPGLLIAFQRLRREEAEGQEDIPTAGLIMAKSRTGPITVCLDDLQAAHLTPAAGADLLALIEAVIHVGGQLLIASWIPAAALAREWSGQCGMIGATIAAKIDSYCDWVQLHD